jgi:hypothetical protein
MPPRNFEVDQRRRQRRWRRNYRRIFINMTNHSRNSRNSRLINSHVNTIIQIPTPQICNNPFEESLFNGSSFSSNDSFETLILPAGNSTFSLFP